MHIRVQLHSILKDLTPNHQGLVEIECPPETTVRELLQLLKLDRGEVGLIVVNNKKILSPGDSVPPGEVISMYPIFGGG